MKFFDLPASLAIGVLSEWIDLKSFVKLDTAARVSKECAVPLRDITQSDEFSIQDRVNFSNSTMLAWLFKRKMKVDCFELNSAITEDCLPQYLRSFGQFIRGATFGPDCDAHVIRLVAVYCRQLTSIHKDCEHGQVAALCDLLSCNANLEELRLMELGKDDVPLLSLISCPHMQRFSLSCSTFESFPWCSFVGPSLRQLHLEKLDGLTHVDLITIGQLCTKLEACAVLEMPVEDATVQEFTSLCPYIVNLAFRNNSVLTDEGVKGVLQNLPKLRILALVGCSELTKAAWKYVAKYCKDTLVNTSADVNTGNISALVEMLKTCHHIRTLTMTSLEHLPTTELEPLFACCGQVRGLAVANALISDEVLCLVGKHCHDLHVLSIFGINENVVLDASFCALAAGCVHLHAIFIDNADSIPNGFRRMWNLIRPQLYFDDKPSDSPYNICDCDLDELPNV